MPLTKEVTAPVFNLTDIFGRQINLEEYADKKVFIGFFRHAGCPFCNLRVHALAKMRDELIENGMEMIYFFESGKDILLRSSFHREVNPIPIISDPDKKWYGAYGLEESGKGSAVGHLKYFVQSAINAKAKGLPVHPMKDGESIKTMPAEFLLGPGLVVKDFHYSGELKDRLDFDAIREFSTASPSVKA
ncbi:redoxin domain-containing protein [Roseivirga sp. BDSF3-8]|uniref:redoxin domain-containing protein n=1 Tax=Roseivirga sp. BDSF3-8 TaxID=3241598 RepID=UPI00353228BD